MKSEGKSRKEDVNVMFCIIGEMIKLNYSNSNSEGSVIQIGEFLKRKMNLIVSITTTRVCKNLFGKWINIRKYLWQITLQIKLFLHSRVN